MTMTEETVRPAPFLTDREISAFKPIDRPRDHFDANPDYPGHAVRVAPSGRKTFTFHFTLDGKRGRLDLGSYPALTLKESRARALAARRAVDDGRDPRDEKRDATALTVSKIVAEYIADLKRAPESERLRTIDDIDVMLRNQVVAFIGDKPATTLSRVDIKGVIDRIRDRGSHNNAYRVFKNLRLAFRWAVAAGHMEFNLMDKMDAPEIGEVGENVRPLDDDEIFTFWHGARDVLPEYCRDTYSRILKLCLLTGCRLGEIAEIEPGEIVDGVLTIGVHRSKNKRAHTVPLNADMLALIGNNFDDPWGLVNGRRIESHRISDDFLGVPAKLQSKLGYTIHGLRRTVATCMDALDIPESTISLCLNHTSADRKKAKDERAATTTRRYIKPKEDLKMQRKRAALNTWAEHLRLLIDRPLAESNLLHETLLAPCPAAS
jgi:integrase